MRGEKADVAIKDSFPQPENAEKGYQSRVPFSAFLNQKSPGSFLGGAAIIAVSFLFPIRASGPEPCSWLALTRHDSVLLTGTESRCMGQHGNALTSLQRAAELL